MIYTVVLILAAFFTIGFANLLVLKQEKNHKITKELVDEVKVSLKNIEDEISSLVNESPTEYDLSNMESQMDALIKCLSYIKPPKNRRSKNVKRKKNFTDD